jgi:hypothetical protein
MRGWAPGLELWAVLLMVTAALAGCSSTSNEGSLTLDHHAPSSPIPPVYVPITSRELSMYPILEKLLLHWERGNMNGSFAGFNEPYPYEDGLKLIAELRGHEYKPGGHWHAHSVVIYYKEEFFDLTAFPPPHR